MSNYNFEYFLLFISRQRKARLLNSTYFLKSSLRLRWIPIFSYRTDYPSGSCLPTLCSRCTNSLFSGRLLIAHYKRYLALDVQAFISAYSIHILVSAFRLLPYYNR
nr:MAG TPA: hypothetical protein [Caudoviricetes sp.]